MPEDFKKGDSVKWKSHGGDAHGTVEKKQTSRTTIKGHIVAASPYNPQFIIKNAERKKAAHKADALTQEWSMAEIDKDYLERRAEAELSLAQAAAHPAAVRAHYLMAGFYLDRLYCADDENAALPGNSPWPGQGRY